MLVSLIVRSWGSRAGGIDLPYQSYYQWTGINFIYEPGSVDNPSPVST
jgi:hypothetical protein